MYIKVYLITYKMLIINIIIPGKIEEWGFSWILFPKLVDQVRVDQVGYFPINGILTFGIK